MILVEKKLVIAHSFEEANEIDAAQWAEMSPQERFELCFMLPLMQYETPPRLERILVIADFPRREVSDRGFESESVTDSPGEPTPTPPVAKDLPV